MTNASAAAERWTYFSEEPRLLSTSDRAIWQGFAFQEIEVAEFGSFRAGSLKGGRVVIAQTYGPMKIRWGGPKKPFRQLLPHPQLRLPGDDEDGVWQGAQRGLHLIMEPNVIEQFTHKPLRYDTLPRINGPHPGVEHLLRALHIDVRHGHPTGPLMGTSILASLLHILMPDRASPRASGRPDAAGGDFAQACDWIEANLAHPFGLDDLARGVGVSVRHLHRTFLAATGLSPYRYVLVRRVERAKSLIEGRRLGLAEIAREVGFYDQAHMAHTFRKVAGAAPSHFSNIVE